MIGIILGILMFMLLVMGHELGHFISAKRSKVKVLEFGIGIPPKVCKLWTDKGGTEYTLNLIPLGGFVRLKGEDPKETEDFLAKDSFITAKVWKKIIILLAGVAANFVIAWALFTVVFSFGTKPISIVPENILNHPIESYLMPTKTFLYQKGYITEAMKQDMEKAPVAIADVLSGGIGASIGLLSGDIIKSINNQSINSRNLEQTLKNNIGGSLAIYVSRSGVSRLLSGSCAEENCILGITFSYSGFSKSELEKFDNDMIKFPVKEAIVVALKEIKAQTELTFVSLGSLGKSLISFDKSKISGAFSKLSGPVGAVKLGDTLLQNGGWVSFLAFAGMISLALAVFNVLPIPALDGGRLLGVLIQWIGRLRPEKYFTIEGYFNMIFFVLLMGLGIFVIFKDLVRFWGVKIPFM